MEEQGNNDSIKGDGRKDCNAEWSCASESLPPNAILRPIRRGGSDAWTKLG